MRGNVAGPRGGSLSNPANRSEVTDWLEFTFAAERDSRRKETDLWLYEEDNGPPWNCVSDGIYVLPGWTRGLALPINIHRHLILPSGKRLKGAGRGDAHRGRRR